MSGTTSIFVRMGGIFYLRLKKDNLFKSLKCFKQVVFDSQ